VFIHILKTCFTVFNVRGVAASVGLPESQDFWTEVPVKNAEAVGMSTATGSVKVVHYAVLVRRIPSRGLLSRWKSHSELTPKRSPFRTVASGRDCPGGRVAS
jgi:hypothetical protein